ncbi:threonine ammonia-lyase [Roseibium alexandrii]|uniref:L-threonine dehydratase catabolic TdcB n=1 Tax=Roseibium alexandrii TaxID=388408 RepID=A0A0M7ABI2_9HYPH|nr:threonine/serine dehydratase [Roseibium alexandrii]CTQ71093.1 L-threonine dehydratase catabolic TdcB [Roseibium alexandrii]
MTGATAERPSSTSAAVTYGDVLEAADALEGVAVKTPLLTNPALDERVGGRVLIKPECLQRSGSFKFRGAYNCLRQLEPDVRARGGVACSSGNHAQGIASSAKIFGMPATIVMPADAPQVKLERTRGYGATVITYDRATEDRDKIASEICAETGATFVHPYNDPAVIAGQGTVGLEMAAQARDLGLQLDDVLACTGGGGLSSGIALALANTSAETVFHTVEPQFFDDYKRSLEAGELLSNPAKSGSICDALLSESPGEIGFSILRQFAGEGFTVTDEQVLDAVAFAFSELKLVVEPGGAAALAALLSGKLDLRERTVGVVLTGGNIDPKMLFKAVSR